MNTRMMRGDNIPVFVRTAELSGKAYLDLGDERRRTVEIDEAGWRVLAEPPEPVPGGSLQELRDLLNLSCNDDFVLIVAWLVAALRAKAPYPLMAITGEPGTGKSTMACMLRLLVDPNRIALRNTPRAARDYRELANNAAMLVFDNLSNIPRWLADELREPQLDTARPTLLTSVADVITDSNLSKGALTIRLLPVSDTQRVGDRAFCARFEAARPRILGALLDAMVGDRAH